MWPLHHSVIDALQPDVEAKGWKLLQPYRYGSTDAIHTAETLVLFELPLHAHVLDVGCGVGEATRLMAEQRPDLRFTLLNFSAAQLNACPDGSEKVLAYAEDMPLEDETFDAVMFNFALGNMDWPLALAEATRVLKPGGLLLINEIFRHAGSSVEFTRELSYRPLVATELVRALPHFGAQMDLLAAPPVTSCPLQEMLPKGSDLFDGLGPRILRARKGPVTTVASRFGRVIGRHERVALAFSGGKDSLATLYLLRPFWPRLTVYWTNPGNPFPETVRQMAELAKLVPNFREVAGRQAEVIAANGWPSDVVPQRHTVDGNLVFGKTEFIVQTRLDCCFRSLMAPMYQAMLDDGVTLCIRGKRREEKDRTGLENGYVSEEGVELCFPIMEWSNGDVVRYLEAEGVPLPDSYSYAGHSLDCMDCTAWWGEGMSKYLEARHPQAFVEYKRRIGLIKQAVAAQMTDCEV